LVESARATLLAEALQNRDALLATGVPEELREAESAARGVVAERQQQLTALSGRRGVPPPELAAARKSLDDAYHDLETAIGRIQRDARRVAEICYPEPIDLDSLRAAIPEDATLLLYACRWDHPFVLALSHDGVELVRLGESDALLATAREYVGLAATPGSDDTRLAADLYEQLLRPLEEQLGTRTRLIFSPDESFALVPFEALLRVEGESRERALERFEISYVPSGTVYATLVAQSRGVPRGERLVALGDPVYPGEAAWAAAGSEGTVVAAVLRDLELRGLGRLARLAASGEEVRAIGAMFPAGSRTLLVREGATKAALLVALAQPGPRVASLHLACHGHVDADHPRLTGVVFTGGEILTVDDVFAAKLPADLVVLSACETGGGKVFKGEGVFGLVRACFFAGAPRVVVTNWSVVDESTRALMVRFYEGMWKERRSAAAALRAAKLSALAGGGAGAHPSRWAGFVLWGLDD
jgi:CHAT domain-containing protein